MNVLTCEHRVDPVHTCKKGKKKYGSLVTQIERNTDEIDKLLRVTIKSLEMILRFFEECFRVAFLRAAARGKPLNCY